MRIQRNRTNLYSAGGNNSRIIEDLILLSSNNMLILSIHDGSILLNDPFSKSNPTSLPISEALELLIKKITDRIINPGNNRLIIIFDCAIEHFSEQELSIYFQIISQSRASNTQIITLNSSQNKLSDIARTVMEVNSLNLFEQE